MSVSGSTPIVSAEELSKSYNKEQVLKSLSFELRPGEITLLLGANGAGKSTLLRTLAGLVRQDGGKLRLCGEPINPRNISQVGYVGHDPLLYPTLTVRENLALFAKLYRSLVDLPELMAQFRLEPIAKREIKLLSRGELFRVGLCRAFLNAPKLFLLDEPSSALDEASSEIVMQRLVSSCRTGSAALIASHDLRRLLPYATRAITIKHGEIIRDSARESFQAEMAIKWYIEAQL